MMFGFDVDKYLKRIQFKDYEKLALHSGETLSALQFAHLSSVPYENFDIIDGIPLNLSTDYLYEKIVDQNRGGYCFELNGLFGDLLRAMDFGVNEYLARFLYEEETIPMRRHRVLEVQASDGVYICDVGIGLECPRIALKFKKDVIQSDGVCEYRFEHEPFLGWVLWQRKKLSEWKKFYSFIDEPQLSVDFMQASFYCEKAPDSIFNKTYMASLKTSDGMITLNDKTFKVTRINAETAIKTAESKEDFHKKISEYFGITIKKKGNICT